MLLHTHIPQYMHVAKCLMAEIASGQFPVGSLLPTEEQLCQEFSFSRVTIRSALKELEMRGLVHRQAGVGTRVEASRSQVRYLHTHDSIGGILNLSSEMRFDVLSQQEIMLSDSECTLLGYPRGARVLHVRALRALPGVLPQMLGEHYIPSMFSAIAARFDKLTGSLAQAIAQDFDDEIEEIKQTFEAAIINAADRRALQVEKGETGLLTTRQFYGVTGRLLLASRSLFPTSRHIYQSTLRRDSMTSLE